MGETDEHTAACDAWADMNGSGCTCLGGSKLSDGLPPLVLHGVMEDEREYLAGVLRRIADQGNDSWHADADAVMASGFRLADAQAMRASSPSQREPSGIPFYDQKMRELDEVRLANAEPSVAQVLRDAIESALRKLKHFPNNGADRVLRVALDAVSDPQRRNGE